MGTKVNNYEDLEVYKLAIDFQQDIFKLTQTFPREELYSLTDQIRRSSRSIGANIAEAWRKRAYVAHFKSKLTDADAEQAETQHWLRTALLCEYITSPQFEEKINDCKHIGAMIGKMMRNAEHWCA